MAISTDRIASIRARWPEHEASWQDVEDLCEEIIRLNTQAQKWALYAFNNHGDDAVLYNGLADLGGVSVDGSGWMGHATLQQIQRRHGVGTAKAMMIQERQKDWPTFLADWVDYNHGKGESDRAWDEFQKKGDQ